METKVEDGISCLYIVAPGTRFKSLAARASLGFLPMCRSSLSRICN